MSEWSCQHGNVSMIVSAWSCQHGHVSMVVSAWSCQHGRVSMVVSAWSCQHGRVSMVMSAWSCQHGHVSMVMSAWSCQHGHVSMVMLAWSCQHGHVSMVMSAWSCQHGHVSMVMATFAKLGTCLDGGARLDIAARGLWSPMEMAFFDVRVLICYTPEPNLTLNTRPKLYKMYGHHKIKRSKERKYGDRCTQIEKGTLSGLVFSTTGSMGPKDPYVPQTSSNSPSSQDWPGQKPCYG